jgi:hypothetical protein
LQLESLEQRQLLAVGPQLAGIQPNDGSLLTNGLVRNVAPRELVFHFSDGAAIDPSTVEQGIRLIRSGFDGEFERAVVSSDFNTNRSVVIDFTAVRPSEAGNGITVSVIKNDLGFGVGPRVDVIGERINVELNTNSSSPTSASQLVAAINGDRDASQLVTAAVRAGTNANADISVPQINYSPLVTSGANAASATSSLGTGAELEVRFTAVDSGLDGNGIEVVILGRDFGGVGSPEVSVNELLENGETVMGRTVTVEVNANAASPTTVEELLDAINQDADASLLVKAELVSGTLNAPIGDRISLVQLRLAGANDVEIEPGFVGLGKTTREVLMRFKEPLADDLYHVQILGTGPAALRNVVGGAFGDDTDDIRDDGSDFGLEFELDLGAQILAVIPQPVTRDGSNRLVQARNEIHVYFNNDDMHPTPVTTGDLSTDPTVVDPNFYQLIFTNDTVHNRDDVVYSPSSISYDPDSDQAVLSFPRSINLLGSGAGTFRLRIGTDEGIPLAPMIRDAAMPFASTDFGTSGTASVDFIGTADFAKRVTVEIRKSNFGQAGGPTVVVTGQNIVVELNSNTGNESTALEVVNAVNANAAASALVQASLSGSPGLKVSDVGGTDVATTATPTTLTLAGLGSSFDTATDLGDLSGPAQVISAAIEPQQFDLPFPGSITEPSQRELRPELGHAFAEGVETDLLDGITTAFYNFQDEYGFDPLGTVLRNAITETQKERAREIFSLWSEFLGIQFIETANLGITIATGDIRALAPTAISGPGGAVSAFGLAGDLNGGVVMDLQDFSAPGDDAYGGSWFLQAMSGVGHLIGIGFTDELPPTTTTHSFLTVAGPNYPHPFAFPENTVEPIFPGAQDVNNGQHLFRPDSKDIDLWRFEVAETGRFSAEVFAERLPDTSLLDATLSLFRQQPTGERELVARNDDYYSNDSYLEMDLESGIYWVGVSASGNDDYDPTIDDTGLGGRSEGAYDLRLNFRPDADRVIRDATDVALDGDADGVPGGVHNFWLRAQFPSNTIYVDKAATGVSQGTLDAPFNNISTALSAADEGDVVRIIGNGGADGDVSTFEDNLAYEIGFNRIGRVLADGSTLDVPKGVTVMIDSGAVLKLRRARLGVGSSSAIVDRSAGALQVLGTPVLLDGSGAVIRDLDGNPEPGIVFFTSIHDLEIGIDTNPDAFPPPAEPGDWGGLSFRNDIDKAEAGRFSYDRQGIFLNHVGHADIRYGGANLLVDGVPQIISPIHITDARPTVEYNQITLSADAAISASPNSFEEGNFHAPFAQFTPFTADYKRVGPDVQGNIATDNSINGMFIRVSTPAGTELNPLSVPGRFDDADVTHVLSDRLIIRGTAGGHIIDADTPASQLVTLTAVSGGQLDVGDYSYRIVFVDADGYEGPPSAITSSTSISVASENRAIALDNLPAADAGFVARRIYRSNKSADPNGVFTLVAEINANSPTFTDFGSDLGSPLTSSVLAGLRARQDARLAIDPGVVVKLNGGAIETTLGADFYAEGSDGAEIVFTSVYDDRFGAGGTFDTTNDQGQIIPAPGNWGGVRIGPASRASMDFTFVSFGGGEINIEGTSTGFNAIEIHQSPVRIAHSTLENNAGGTGGQAAFDRAGRGFNRDGTIFVRGSQPVILENTLVNNAGPGISIDALSLSFESMIDIGRSTYGTVESSVPIDRSTVGFDNQGPLVRLNRLDFNDVNGMQVRGGTLTTEGVWDDTDIVHVLRNERVYVPDFHTFGGLRLESSPTESLVVKLDGPEAGIVASGRPLDINDRIGGSVHSVGQPSHPVVMTSIHDCTVGAGFTPGGDPMNDTLNSGACSVRDVPSFVDVIVLADESASMISFQLFTQGLIDDLEAALLATGIGATAAGANQYGLVGFGGQGNDLVGHAHPVGAGGALFGTSGEYRAAVNTLVENGGLEDGYTAIDFALANYPLRPDAEPFLILVSNEDRDILDASLNFNSVLADMQAAGVKLQGILELDISDTTGNAAIAANRTTAFLGDGLGGFTTAPLGSLTTGDPFFSPTVVPDYVQLIEATGGISGDLSFIGTGVGADATSFSNILVNSIVSQAGAGRTGQPGDWDSFRLDEYSNDRNFEIIVENEAVNSSAPGPNATSNGAQFLGLIAPHEKLDDDNRRLGFEVDGRLTARNDVDTYSFNALAGTEVWFDIDFTGNSLDTVLELIDASGQVVLARSNDSQAESLEPTLLFTSPLMSPGSVLPLSQAGYDPTNPVAINSLDPAPIDSLRIQDHFTTNPRDAGMRVILPGQPGAETTYHVRVRSASEDVANPDLPGLTRGTYTLQVRLQELDEVPGSTVRYSDIRFATNGVEVIGLPLHSPLLGEATETESFSTGGQVNSNDTLATAQEIGNLATTDRGAISLAGDLFDFTDVDFYRMTVERDLVGLLAPNDHLAAIFDIDYADGLGRPNAAIWIFDSDGRLILTSTGSNIADDRPRPLSGDDTEDLTRGSIGTLDPYIGPVELPAGPITSLDGGDFPADREVYFVAVSSNGQRPQVLEQYLNANPANSLVRLEPVNSVQRIAEDRIGFSGGSRIADPPEIPILLDPNNSAVPFELGDVTLYVTQPIGLAPATVSTLRLVDPFTGALEATAGSFPQPISDIAMRGDGNLFGYSVGPDNFSGPRDDATVGGYVQIDTATGAGTTIGDDGPSTNVADPTSPPGMLMAEPAPVGGNDDGVGISWDAITFRTDADTQFFNGFTVGSRNANFAASPNDFTLNSPEDVARAGTNFLENVLYHFDIADGVIANRAPAAPDRMDLLGGVGTQKIEFGEILTFTRLAPRSVGIGDMFTVNIGDESISYTSLVGTTNEVVRGLAAEWRTAASTTPVFAAFEVLNSTASAASELHVRLTDSAFANRQIQGETSNGDNFAFESLAVTGFGPGGRVTGIDFVNGQMYAVTNRGGLYRVNAFGGNLATYVRTSATDLMTGDDGQPIEFSGLTAGPPNAGGGKYADLLFGITTDGEMYALSTDGALQPVFVNNQTSVNTGLFGANGLAFSTLDRNLWTVTGERGGDVGHGSDGNSFFFGNDDSTNRGGNQAFSNSPFVRDFNFPGGAHGSVISNPFSLQGYSPDDLPVLYFNYFLDTEGTDYDPDTSPITPTRDTLRVFVGDDNGEWTLVATNDNFQDFERFDEFDIGENDVFCDYPSFGRDPCVQNIWDNTGGWRQVRVPLNNFAGRESLRLRFDFATAGEINVGDTFTVGSELRAIESDQLRDGQTFSLDGQAVIEFDLGFTIQAPNGAAIQDGDSFTIDSLTAGPRTLEFDIDGNFARDILVRSGDQYRDGQTFFVSNGSETQAFEFDSGSGLLVPAAGAQLGGVVEGDTFILDVSTFEFDSDGLFGNNSNSINTVVDQEIRIPAAGGSTEGIADGEQFLINDGQGGADVIFEFDSNESTSVGSHTISLNNVEIQIPITGGGFGGVRDGDTFTISGGTGTTTFEFDNDNDIASGSQTVVISNNSTQDQIGNEMVRAMIQADIGLDPDYVGGALRVGVFRHTVDVSGTSVLQTRTVPATANEVVDRAVDRILNLGLGLTPINAGIGLIRIGSTTHVVNVGSAPSLSVQPVSADQDQLADQIVTAIRDAGVGVFPLNVGNGQIFLGTPVVDSSGSATLDSFGAPGLVDPNANLVVLDPTQGADQIAFSIVGAINRSTLNLTVDSTDSVVELPRNTSFNPNGLALSPSGVTAVSFAANQSPDAVSQAIKNSIELAFEPEMLTARLVTEGNDSIATAVVSGMTGGPAIFESSGVIGDNSAFPLEEGIDVDFVKMQLNAGDTLRATTSGTTSLSAGLRLFDATGRQLDLATGLFGSAPTINYSVVSSGTYYVAVSGSDNLTYDPLFAGSADVTLQVPPEGGALGGLTDGELFSIDDGSGSIALFEFDSDSSVRPGALAISIADLVIVLPASGTGFEGIQDGDFFVINDNRGSGDVVFEYDSDNVTRPGAQPIVFNLGNNAAQLTISTVNVLSASGLGLSPSILNNNKILLGTTTHTVDLSGAEELIELSLPRPQSNILIQLRDAIRQSGLGLNPIIGFGTINIDITGQTVDTSQAPNLTKVVPTGFVGTTDVTLEVPLEGAAFGGLSDGELFSIDDGSGASPTLFEFDNNGSVRPGALAISIAAPVLEFPEVGADLGGVEDGQFFTINDNRGSGDVVFEFDSDNSTRPGAQPILFNVGDDARQLAVNTFFVLNSSDLGLVGTSIVNSKIALGTTTHTVDLSGTPSLSESSLPRPQANILIQIRDAIRQSGLDLNPVVGLETINIDVPAESVDTSQAPNLKKVSNGNYDLEVEVVNPLQVVRADHRLNLTSVADVSQTGLPPTFIDGRPGGLTPNRTTVPITSALTKNQVARATADAIGREVAGYNQQIIAVDGSLISDGEIFSVSDGVDTVNFEFESGFSIQIPNPAADPNAILDGEFFTITTSTGLETFEFDIDGSVSQGTPLRVNDLTIRIPQGGMNSGLINDGDFFTVTRPGAPPRNFEFDTDGIFVVENEIIRVTPTSSAVEVANATAQALLDAGIGLDPQVMSTSSGFFNLTTLTDVQLGIIDHEVDTQNSPGIFDFLVDLSQDEIAERLANLIAIAGLNLSPSLLGGGLIHLGGTAGDTIDISNAINVVVIGEPGLFDSTAVVLPVFPSVETTATNVANLIQAAVNTARIDRGLDVTALIDGARRVNLRGQFVATDVDQAPSLTLSIAGDAVTTYENIVRVIGHTITNPGPFGVESSLAGDNPFGAFNISGPPNVTSYPGALRGMDNAHEGAYIDDIVIGFAERGEIVTGATVDTTFIRNNELFNIELPRHNEIHPGPYQLEIRHGEPFGRTFRDVDPEILFTRTFDTNDRLTDAVSLTVPGGHAIADGDTFTVSDGTTSVTIEFEDVALNNGVVPGNVSLFYDVSDTDEEAARRVRDAINSPQVQAVLDIQAGMADGLGAGSRVAPGAPISTSNVVNLYGNATFTIQDSASTRRAAVSEPNDILVQAIDSGIGSSGVIEFIGTGTIGDNAALADPDADVDLIRIELGAGQTVTIDIDADVLDSTLDSVVRVFDFEGLELAVNDDFNGPDSFLQFTAIESGTHYVGVSGFFNAFYSPLVAESDFGFENSTGSYEITITAGSTGFAQRVYHDLGDSNVAREQGQILVHSNQIRSSLQYGVRVAAGARDTAADSPHMGPVRVTHEVNSERVAPGAVVENNVISFSGAGGIHFSGETNLASEQLGSVPFGRIVNNTIFGGLIGVEVGANASPTLVNNIISSTGTAVDVDPTSASTVLTGTLFKGNATNTSGIGLGSFPITLSDSDPLFVDELNNNFYLEPGSAAIDSSVDTIEDRPDLIRLKSPLGMGASPILAPDQDVFGQTRVDDPTVDSPPGQGANIFKDRGALDRADFAGPTAVLLNPRDNDALEDDSDPRVTFIELVNQVVTNFAIQLLDGVEPDDPQDGTGADDRTVLSENVNLLRDREKLIEDDDYKFSYDATNNIIRITPLAGIWEQDRVYEIELSNSEGFVIEALDGTEVSDGDQFELTDEFGTTVTFEYESGFSLRVPQTLTIQVPENGGADLTDGATFTIADDVNTVIFEFDDNGAFVDVNDDGTPDNEVIEFTDDDSANDIANSIVAAISVSGDFDLAPVNIVNFFGRAVNLGSQAIHSLDTTASGLTQTGLAAGIEDQQTFRIDDGTKVVDFEFTTGTGGAETFDIPFSYSQTHEQIADAIVDAILAADVNLAPRHPRNSEGLVHLGGTTRHQIFVASLPSVSGGQPALLGSQLSLSGKPGVRAEFEIQIPTIAGQPDFETILDGETFTITAQGNSATLELDEDGETTPGNLVVVFNNNTTTDQLANAIAIAIRNASLGLLPSNDGNGVISLGGTANLDLTNTSLTQLGQSGIDAAQPIPFVPGDSYEEGIPMRNPVFTSTEMATSIAASINTTVAAGLLSEVLATARDEEVVVDGVVSIQGSAVTFRSNIRDGAGNPLKPNRDDGTTRFTIFIGTGVDYGDAPDSYGTLETSNGARHEVIADFFLGTGIDVDITGQPSSLADGDNNDGMDDEDGVVFNAPLAAGGSGSTVTVTASKPGSLDAWVDFNGDGDFNDVNEQIFFSQAIGAGENTLPVTAPGDAKGGDSFARFRFSSSGGLGPVGFASDGEVEDYVVSILGNPWRNTDMAEDVNGDGLMSPIDALLLINEINVNGARDLPNPPDIDPPPFLDVNGDGQLTATGDVLPVINMLNAQSGGEGELGEGEFGESLVVAAQPSSDSLGSGYAPLVDHRIAIEPTENEDDERDREEAALFTDPSAWQVTGDAVGSTAADLGSASDREFDDLLDDLAADVARDLGPLEKAFGEL